MPLLINEKMSVLYITQPDAVINKAQEAFKIALKQEDGTGKSDRFPPKLSNK